MLFDECVNIYDFLFVKWKMLLSWNDYVCMWFIGCVQVYCFMCFKCKKNKERTSA